MDQIKEAAVSTGLDKDVSLRVTDTRDGAVSPCDAQGNIIILMVMMMMIINIHMMTLDIGLSLIHKVPNTDDDEGDLKSSVGSALYMMQHCSKQEQHLWSRPVRGVSCGVNLDSDSTSNITFGWQAFHDRDPRDPDVHVTHT